MTWTRDRLKAAEYFLQCMVDKRAERDAFRYNLEAFITALRSVTWIMQSEFHDVPGFLEWYDEQKAIMKADNELKPLHAKRNTIQKDRPISPVASVRMAPMENVLLTDSLTLALTRPDGTVELVNIGLPATFTQGALSPTPYWEWHFDDSPSGSDIPSFCRSCFAKIGTLVAECERLFADKVPKGVS